MWILIASIVIAALASFLYFYVLKLPISQPVAHAPAPTPTLAQTQTSNETWKTYKVASFYEIKLPSDKFSPKDEIYYSGVFPNLIEKESKSFVSNFSLKEERSAAGNYILRILIFDNVGNLSINDPKNLFVRVPLGCSTEALKSKPISEIVLGNIKAYQMNDCTAGLSGTETQIITIKDNRIIEIQVEPRGGSGIAKKTLEKIISTFKFIEN